MDANRFTFITVTKQKELDEFLNNTTIDKLMYCIDVRADEPLVVETREIHNFRIFDSSVVTFLDTPVSATIEFYDDAVAIMQTKDDYHLSYHFYCYNNSTIINHNENSVFFCDLFDNAKFVDKCLNQDVPREANLYITDISTQKKLDECLNLYGNCKNVNLYMISNDLDPGSELVVNKKINGKFYMGSKNRVVFKMPTNADNDSIDYCIHAFGKSTAILETNNCKIIAFRDATIIKRCKDDIAYKYIKENAKLVDESHLLDTNKHKETSKGRGK